MAVNISGTSGYMFLDSWVMSSVIQLGTIAFAQRFLNQHNDPCGRQFDQMTQAARSVQANIAEGSSRHQTSYETELKLLDVARGSLNELTNDLTFMLMSCKQLAWKNDNEMNVAVRSIKLEHPDYSSNLQHDVTAHVLAQKAKFDKWLDSSDIAIAANALIVMCSRLNSMLTSQIKHRLSQFKDDGGFAENLTKERIATLQEQSVDDNAPSCPHCGSPMIKKVAQRGRYQGQYFWSCSKHYETGCKGIINIK